MSIPEAVDQVGGLQTQYAPSGYVGLWTRLAGLPARGAHGGPRGSQRHPGDADADDDPHGLGARVLAVRHGRPPAPPGMGAEIPGRDVEEASLVEAAAQDASGAGGRAADGQGARRSGGGVRRQPRASGWISCASRRRAHGRGGGPIDSPLPRTGSVRRTSRRTRAWSTSSGPICGRSARHRGATSPRGPGCLLRTPSGDGERLALSRLPRRRRPGAGRSRRCAAAGSGNTGAGPLPPALGREPARPRATHRDPARGIPPSDLQHPQSVLGRDVPRRRRRGGCVVGPRRADRTGPLRDAHREGSGAVDREREALEAFHA